MQEVYTYTWDSEDPGLEEGGGVVGWHGCGLPGKGVATNAQQEASTAPCYHFPPASQFPNHWCEQEQIPGITIKRSGAGPRLYL